MGKLKKKQITEEPVNPIEDNELGSVDVFLWIDEDGNMEEVPAKEFFRRAGHVIN